MLCTHSSQEGPSAMLAKKGFGLEEHYVVVLSAHVPRRPLLLLHSAAFEGQRDQLLLLSLFAPSQFTIQREGPVSPFQGSRQSTINEGSLNQYKTNFFLVAKIGDFVGKLAKNPGLLCKSFQVSLCLCQFVEGKDLQRVAKICRYYYFLH